MVNKTEKGNFYKMLLVNGKKASGVKGKECDGSMIRLPGKVMNIIHNKFFQFCF